VNGDRFYPYGKTYGQLFREQEETAIGLLSDCRLSRQRPQLAIF
jgi:hypothetical protein